jgi:hypothetical protein
VRPFLGGRGIKRIERHAQIQLDDLDAALRTRFLVLAPPCSDTVYDRNDLCH